MPATTHATRSSRTHRILIGVVVTGAALIAAIGFAGSYTAVRDLAERKGFGAFSAVFPIGVDAGIVVLLALDLLLTRARIPFPLLRQTAWLLTAATIAFNGAAAWPDPLGVGMHAVIPVLFVVAVEAARHAVGRIADLTADKHMEGVRLARWLLAFPSTFRLWRRMKLWELRSYDEVIKLERDRLVYRTRLRARYGRAWRRRAPVEALLPLRLARYGVPLTDTGAAGLTAAGIETPAAAPAPGTPVLDRPPTPVPTPVPAPEPESASAPEPAPTTDRAPAPGPTGPAAESPPHEPRLAVPVGPGRTRPLGGTPGPLPIPEPRAAREPHPAPEPRPVPEARPRPEPATVPEPTPPAPTPAPIPEPTPLPTPEAPAELPGSPGLPDDAPRDEAYYEAFRTYVAERNHFPDSRQFGRHLLEVYGVTGREGGPLTESCLRAFVREFRQRLREEVETAEHIP
ncbi:DUF2637 domain-containing protein [Streptomyces sp. NPDC018045]|uniref:DUF2637 domain-containing protein n=1 Tax=Streptomyces sp. NPDC018045 TaxID=3365037 RepID=UPI0037ADFDE9